MEHNEMFRSLLDHVYEGIYFVDVDRKITFWNRGAEKITGFSAEEVVGKHCFSNILNHVDEIGTKLCFGGCPLHATIQDGEDRTSKVYLHHKAGHRVAVNVKTTPLIENDVIIGAIELFVDEAGEFAEQFELSTLREIAYYDQLTELPNRRYIDHYLLSQMNLFQALGTPFGVAFLDIDYFKKVNDNYGHLVGDETLKIIAKSLNSGLRDSDVIGRWGGEEFVCILTGISPESLAAVCEKLRMLVENSSIQRNDLDLKVTISIGGTMSLEGESLEALVHRADQLLYNSKQTGRNRVTIG